MIYGEFQLTSQSEWNMTLEAKYSKLEIRLSTMLTIRFSNLRMDTISTFIKFICSELFTIFVTDSLSLNLRNNPSKKC